MKPQAAPGLLLLGGSFNPPHIAHLRAALEAREALKPEKTLFIPTASPPHKPEANLLPFEMRAAMLNESIAALPKAWRLEVCAVENERQGPSYTYDTLAVLAGRRPEKRLTFVMGAEDYAQLDSWRRWADIPCLADLAVMPRKRHGEESFRQNTLRLWPDAREISPCANQNTTEPGAANLAASCSARSVFQLPGGGRSLYLPLPLLEISSSLIRERFLAGLSIDYLVPPAVQAMLEESRAYVSSLWR